MAKKLSKGGLKLVAGGPGRRPMAWRVTHPALSQAYAFTPGVATFVEPADLAWFKDPENLGGREFEVVAPDAAPAGQAPHGGRSGASGSPGTPAGGSPSGGSAGASGAADKNTGGSAGVPADTKTALAADKS